LIEKWRLFTMLFVIADAIDATRALLEVPPK
jgi:hypothetical protein